MLSSSYESLTPAEKDRYETALATTFEMCRCSSGSVAPSPMSRDAIVAGLRLYPDGPLRDALADALRECCLGGDDCAMWDVLEAAAGRLREDRPAGCPRTDAIPSDCMSLSVGAKKKLCADLPCSVPPFSSVRCWLPYALLGLVVGAAGGAVVTHLVAKRRSKKV